MPAADKSVHNASLVWYAFSLGGPSKRCQYHLNICGVTKTLVVSRARYAVYKCNFLFFLLSMFLKENIDVF